MQNSAPAAVSVIFLIEYPFPSPPRETLSFRFQCLALQRQKPKTGLGPTGEVRLDEGGRNAASDEDYHNFKEWGIEIKVKFREGSSLQVLSARVQSGGERSVSTIMYLMAMQELMVR